MKTLTMLHIIFNDMVERGMTTIPEKVLENVTLESNLSDMLPTDKDIINLFKNAANDNDCSETTSLFTALEIPESIQNSISILEDYNNGDGNEAVFVVQYVTKVGQKIIIKYLGTYSSWDETNWYYMGYVPEPKPYIAYYYDVTDIVSI